MNRNTSIEFKKLMLNCVLAAAPEVIFVPINPSMRAVLNSESYFDKDTAGFAMNWARLVELCLDNGLNFIDCAEKTFIIADFDGVFRDHRDTILFVLEHIWDRGVEFNNWHYIDGERRPYEYENNHFPIEITI